MVGRQAKRFAVQNPDSTYYSVKRLIGRKFDDPIVKDEARRLAYNVSCICPGPVHVAPSTRTGSVDALLYQRIR